MVERRRAAILTNKKRDAGGPEFTVQKGLQPWLASIKILHNIKSKK